MTTPMIALTIALAVLVGVSLGLLGGGGSILTVPLLAYVAIIAFSNATDRTLNPYLLYCGLMLTLVVRFEFMGTGFAKAIALMATGSLCVIIWMMIHDVLA